MVMVISFEREVTYYAMNHIFQQWVKPYFYTSQLDHFDLSCKSYEQSGDQVLDEAVKAGKRIAALFKEPTVTPNVIHVVKIGLSKVYGSPNCAMCKGWYGGT